MKSAHLIVVGKLKDKHLEAIEHDYVKRLKAPKLQIHEVKAKAENKDLEAQVVLKKINSISATPFIITLTEFGDEFYSPKFSKWLYSKMEQGREVFFVICGAEGPGSELLEKTHAKLSLSKMTMPHRIARIVFVEQYYRAQTIHTGHPYHN